MNPDASERPSLPDETHVGLVHLRVTNLAESLAFYHGALGLLSTSQTESTATLAAAHGAPNLIRLTALPGTHPRPEYAYGLYHFAILYPTRALLGNRIARVADANWPFSGMADHGVSEAAYLSDPDGNGIELYHDRPREEWPGSAGRIVMYTRPMDVNGVLAEAATADERDLADTRIGHVHLHVRDLSTALAFYRDVIGFDLITEFPGALFLSAGGYHHHLAVNVWARIATESSAAGLLSWTVVVPDEAARTALRRRAEHAGALINEAEDKDLQLRDSDGNVVSIVGP